MVFTHTAPEFFDSLKAEKFDMLLTEPFQHFGVLAKMFSIKTIFKVQVFPLEATSLSLLTYFYVHSSEPSTFSPIILGMNVVEDAKERYYFGERMRNFGMSLFKDIVF